MDEQQRQRLADAVADVLQRRNLTVNAASKRFGLDRNTLAKFAEGIPAGVEWVERWANYVREPVNKWRELAGYQRVEPSPDEAAEVLAKAEKIEIKSALGKVSQQDRIRVYEILKELGEID